MPKGLAPEENELENESGMPEDMMKIMVISSSDEEVGDISDDDD